MLRHRIAFAWTLCAFAFTAASCSDDTSGGETEEGFVDQEAPVFDGVTLVTPVGMDSLDIEWNPATDNISAADEISYRIYLSTEPGGQDFSTPDLSTEPGQTSASIDGLTDGTAYYVVVRAVDEFDNEDTNVRERVGTVGNLSAPDFGGILFAEGTGPDTVQVTWNAATDAETPSDQIVYNIYTAASDGGQDYFMPIATTEPGATEFTLTGLDDYTSYWVAVRAMDSGGREDDNTKNIEALTLDGTAPDFGGVTFVTPAGDGVLLEWTAANDNADNGADLVYNVYQASSSGGQDFTNPVATSVAGAFGVTLDGLDLSTDYYFVVRAQDTAGNEDDNSIEISATTGAISDETPPEFFGVILAQGTGSNSVQLSWDPASDDDTPEGGIVYDIYVSDTPGGQDFGAAPAMSTGPGVTTVAVEPLAPQADHYFVVRARDIAGNQDSNTTEAGATTLVDELAPTFAGGANIVATGPQTLEVSWAPAVDDGDNPGEIRYQIFLSTTQGAFDFTNADFVTAPGRTMIELGDLEPDTDYYVVVRALDTRDNADDNEVELSEATWPDTIPPVFTSAPVASQQGLSDVFVDWENAVDDVDEANDLVYEVYVATSPGGYNFTTPAATTQPGLTEATISELIPGTTYYFTIRAVDQAGNEGDSGEASDTTVADTIAPTFEGAFQILGASATNVTVAWPEATDNYSPHSDLTYHVCWVDSSVSGPTGCSGSNFTSMATTVGATQFNVPGLIVSRTYFIVVRAEDEFGNRESNSRVVVATTTPDLTPPQWDAPSNMSDVNATTLNEGQVNLTWNTVTDNVTTDSGNIAFDIYVATGASAMNFSVPHTTVIGVNSTTVSGLTPNTLHRFVVRARDLAGNRTTNTDEDSATTSADNTAPTGGVVSNATATGCKSIFVTWSGATDVGTPSNDIDYLVCVGTISQCGGTAFSNVVATVTGSTSTTVSVSNPGFYYVKVRARDSSNNTNGNNSFDTISTTSQDTGNPSTPSGFSLSTSASTPYNVLVNWNDSSDSCWSSTTLQYQICRSTSSAGCTSSNWSTYLTTGNGVDIYTLTSQSQDTTYYIGVRATDDSGNVSGVARGSVKTKVAWGGSGLEGRFVSSCDGSGCHTGGWSYGEMVGVTGTGCSNTAMYIDPSGDGGSLPGEPDKSRIYFKVAYTSPTCSGGTAGARMPYGGPYWTSSQVTDLYDWIDQGAVHND